MDITSSRNPWNQSPWHPHPAGSRDQHPPEQDLRNSRQNPFSTRTLPERTNCANRRAELVVRAATEGLFGIVAAQGPDRSNIEASRGGIGLSTDGGAVRLGTAFVDQKAHQSPHHGIIGAANEGGGVTLLRDQPHDEQRLEVMRER